MNNLTSVLTLSVALCINTIPASADAECFLLSGEQKPHLHSMDLDGSLWYNEDIGSLSMNDLGTIRLAERYLLNDFSSPSPSSDWIIEGLTCYAALEEGGWKLKTLAGSILVGAFSCDTILPNGEHIRVEKQGLCIIFYSRRLRAEFDCNGLRSVVEAGQRWNVDSHHGRIYRITQVIHGVRTVVLEATYSAAGRVTKIEEPNCSMSFEWNDHYLVNSEITDDNGRHKTHCEYYNGLLAGIKKDGSWTRRFEWRQEADPTEEIGMPYNKSLRLYADDQWRYQYFVERIGVRIRAFNMKDGSFEENSWTK